MKRYLACEVDFENFKEENEGYRMFAIDEDTPITFPTVVTYNVSQSPYSIKMDLNYSFVYLNDFETVEDPKRNELKSQLNKYRLYTVEYEDADGYRTRCYVNCSGANVLRHYDAAKKMNCRIIYTKE